MTKQRLSRNESRELTRQRILDAALSLFMRDGFRATSLEQIASGAGYTIGAIYSNFSGKLDIGIAVVDLLYARASARVLAVMDIGTPSDPATRLDQLWQILQPELGNPQWARLEMEVAAFGQDTPAFATAVAARMLRFRQLGQALITHWCSATGIPVPTDLEARATTLIALILGLGIQLAMDPSLQAETLKAALYHVVLSLICPEPA